MFLLSIGIVVQAAHAAPPMPSEPFEEFEKVELAPVGPHWVWVTDLLVRHSQLFDAGSGEMLASVESALGSFPKTPIFSDSPNEYYVVEAKNEWGYRGKRTDFITVYDATTMAAKGQIVVPTQTAESAADNQHYMISYNDCCGKSFCGRCVCNRNEGERPDYHWYRANDINWCGGASSQAYHCSLARVVGRASEQQPER